MEVTKDYLRKIYDYNPDTDSLIYRKDESKPDYWNEKNVGQEVKPILSSGKKYIFCLDSLYSFNQLISIYEIGDYMKPHKYDVKQLIAGEEKVKELIKKKPLEVLKRLNRGESVEGVLAAIKRQPKNKMFNLEGEEINSFTGLPKHIYHDDVRGYYVKVKFYTRSHARTHLKDVEEALRVRNDLYKELNEAVTRGEEMISYVTTSNRK